MNHYERNRILHLKDIYIWILKKNFKINNVVKDGNHSYNIYVQIIHGETQYGQAIARVMPSVI